MSSPGLKGVASWRDWRGWWLRGRSIVAAPQDWPWSSARAHLAGRDDGVVDVAPLCQRIGDFESFLGSPQDEVAIGGLRRSRSTGRPVGPSDWIAALE